MKRLFFCLFASTSLFASNNQLTVDIDYSPFMGADAILFTHTGLIRAEDALIEGPPELKNKASRRWGRFLELMLFWGPLNHLFSVTEHEVFGHGYRIRSLGKSVAEVDKYKIKTPFPYGLGGGATYFEFQETGSVSDILAITIGGIEGENVLADTLRLRFLETSKIDGRIATLYTQSELSFFWYSVITSLSNLDNESIDEPSGNDIESYIFWMNKLYPEKHLSVGDVQWQAALNILDPYVWFGYYSWLMYLIHGTPITPPMIQIGSFRYLPGLRVAMAPYGLEYYLLNSLSYDGKGATFYLRGGKYTSGYGGAGIRVPTIYTLGPARLGVIADIWNQPDFQEFNSAEDTYYGITPGPRSGINAHQWGGHVSLSMACSFTKNDVAQLYLEGGVKTKGYLQGYPIQGSPILRGGFIFQY